MTDPWEAFGDGSDDDDDDDDQDQLKLVQCGIVYLTKHFVKHNPQLGLSKRLVATTGNSDWGDALRQRGVLIATDNFCDAAIVMNENYSQVHHVVPGGCVLIVGSEGETPLEKFHPAVWNVAEGILIEEHKNIRLWAVDRWACPVNSLSCPWKPKSQSSVEQRLLQKACIVPSAYALLHNEPLSQHAIEHAIRALKEYGYCIVRNLLDPTKCQAWGKAVLQDLRVAAHILLTRDDIDLYHPHDSKRDPHSYRELSMREDLRMDLRDGPNIRKLRIQEDCDLADTQAPVIIQSPAEGSTKSCLRLHPTVLHIVQQVLNPTDASLASGNFGRHNFEGNGPDGSPQPLRVGPMGGIIALPGSADQAIHADTPHLYELYDCLPAHYVNAFCLGAHVECEKDCYGMSTGATPVGGTAFIHASHKLSFTASLKENWSVATEQRVLQNLVRPSLEIGDVLLFDCRILHFGLANSSKDVERPLLYTNLTQAWFHDPKNWDDREAIFQAN